MKVTSLQIKNFRGVKSATLLFEGHTLMIGRNNVGKSTVCEALDLLLGPDRLRGYTPIDEYDFYNAEYLNAEGERIYITVEGVITDLTQSAISTFGRHIEYWHTGELRLLAEGEIDAVDQELVVPAVRLIMKGWYDADEDEFQAKTFFSHSPDEDEGELKEVGREVKREFGFLYLRAIRTGSRALSLERGSLLDILLKVGQFKPKLWEDVRKQLKDLNPPLDSSIGELRPILDNIEARIKQYVPIDAEGSSTRLFVSQLTREHLRKTLSFFMSSSVDQSPVPFQRLGTGTLNTLVFALLSAISDMKKDSVIFAMEEPEIAISPHTQRRIVRYLMESTSQTFVTSHSPYVIEKFTSDQIKILDRTNEATLTSRSIVFPNELKPKTFHRELRKSIAEAMLGKAVLIGEGATECVVLSAIGDVLEEAEPELHPMDLSGVTYFDGGGDPSFIAFGTFFKGIELKSYALFDQKQRTAEQNARIQSSFDIATETTFTGIEELLAEEIPVEVQWDFLVEIRDSGVLSSCPVPTDRPADERIKELTVQVLKPLKGDPLVSGLIKKCNVNQLPATIVAFMREVYAQHPRPEDVPPIEEIGQENKDEVTIEGSQDEEEEITE